MMLSFLLAKTLDPAYPFFNCRDLSVDESRMNYPTPPSFFKVEDL